LNRSDNIRHFFIGLGLLAVQVILLRHLKINGAEADLLLIFLLWLSTRKNRTEILLFAAVFGFLQDALTDLWGLNMFSKTFLLFFAHNYLNKISENSLILWQIFLILLIASLAHNFVLLSLSMFVEIYSTGISFWTLLLGSSLYTAVVGSFLYLTRSE
jgi:rod shape-determining protein MreD